MNKHIKDNMVMKHLKYGLLFVFMLVVSDVFPQSDHQEAADEVSTEWKVISLGKLQKKPRFKEPMISVKFVNEDGESFLNLSLKYMFTDAVFEEAVPVEYYKSQKIEFSTSKGKYELTAVRYAKARRMNSVAQKTADIRVLFAGDLSFLKDNLVNDFVVHYAQGYQNISLNKEEAAHLQDAYKKYLAISLPRSAVKRGTVKTTPTIEGQVSLKAPEKAVDEVNNSLDELRKRAKNWKK